MLFVLAKPSHILRDPICISLYLSDPTVLVTFGVIAVNEIWNFKFAIESWNLKFAIESFRDWSQRKPFVLTKAYDISLERFCWLLKVLRPVIAWVHIQLLQQFSTHCLQKLNAGLLLLQCIISYVQDQRENIAPYRSDFSWKKVHVWNLNLVYRRTGSLAMKLAKGIWLFDCGEDTQRQIHKQPLIRNGRVDRIFLTNRRPENWTGLPGITVQF